MSSNEDFSNEDQSYAAGLIEGYLSEDMIYTHSKNIYGEKQPSEFVVFYFWIYFQIQSILDENVEWEKKESAVGDQEYWSHRHYLDLQVDGVYDGYMAANKDKPDRVSPFFPNRSRLSRSGKSNMRITMATWAIGTRFHTLPPLILRRASALRTVATPRRSTIWTTAAR